jgi:HEAT repeat protein
LRSETALAATEALRGRNDRAAVEGLLELVYRSPSAREVLAALSVLDECQSSLVVDTLGAALDSLHATVRLKAVEALQRRGAIPSGETLPRLLASDTSWPVRRAALDALADGPAPQCWRILVATDDPHWRVRHALVRVLLQWGESAERRREIETRLQNEGKHDTRRPGVLTYLRYRWSSEAPATSIAVAPSEFRVPPLYDDDPAVLARDLDRMGETGRREALDLMPWLLGHEDERVRTLAAETLRRRGTPAHLAEVVALLDEPRAECVPSVVGLLCALDLDCAEAVARSIGELAMPSPAQVAWRIDQVGVALDMDAWTQQQLDTTEQPTVVRRALARLAWRRKDVETLCRLLHDADATVRREAAHAWMQTEAEMDEAALARCLADEEASIRAAAVRIAFRQGDAVDRVRSRIDDPAAVVRVRFAEGLAARPDADHALLARLQDDLHPYVRAAALTPERAAELVREPERETSWHVLGEAARRMRMPLWKLEPSAAWQPVTTSAPSVAPLIPKAPASVAHRTLGPERLNVSLLGVSGHYGLPVDGFVRAVEAGVNLFFWEPNYRTMTDFLARLSPRDRAAPHLTAGTFEADGARVRRDAERVLRSLKVERIALFLLFWVRSWRRLTPDVREALDDLKRAGKIGTFGLSTHSRPLAIEAMDSGWNPVMVRHSAAHRGAEAQVFPHAAARGTSLITFNNTCYGRLLRPIGSEAPPSAADCYRYTWTQPGVCCCFSAPATLAQLDENLAAMQHPELPPERRERLLAHGAALYQEETIFRRWVRSN